MQTLKTLLIVAVLSAVAYGVYVAMTGARDVEPPPGATTEDWQAGPQVELPTVGMEPPGSPSGPPLGVSAPASPSAQPQPSTLGEAPRYDAASPPADAGAAPPFVAPSIGPGPAAPAAQPVDASPPPFDPSAGAAPPSAAFDPGQAPPPTSAPAPAASPAPPAGAVTQVQSQDSSGSFAGDYAAAQGMLQQGQLDQALLYLSRWYDDPRLTEQDQVVLMETLNQLAGTVIYSREHLLLPAYEVQPGDTLDRIAEHYQVPWQLLAKINGVADPNRLRPGEQLKVVQGPFDAVVNLKSRHLTMMLGGRFAGRFPAGIGADQNTPEGEYNVKDKTTNPTYYGPDRVIDANDPANPLGKYWIGLGNQLGIHGTNDPQSIGRAESRGCIRLGPRDIEDVYDMLTVESRVRILR